MQIKRRVFDLGTLGTSFGAPSSRALGLNSAGTVVGRSTTTDGFGVDHGFVWLFSPAYGLSAFTMYDLNKPPIVPSTITGSTLANDINSHGQIAGSAATQSSFFIPAAFVWQLGNPTLPTISFSPLPGNGTAEALAINDDDPAVVVGVSDSGFGSTRRGFRTTAVASPITQMLGTSSGEFACIEATDVNTPAPGSGGTVTIAGGAITLASDGCLALGPCDSQPAATGRHWQGTAISAILQNLPNPRQHSARGINDAGMTVGVGAQFVAGDPPCLDRAPFWETPTSAPVNLGLIGGIPITDETLANAINNPDAQNRILVVGRNKSANLALLWERDSAGQWTVKVLQETLLSSCGWSFLSDATDVNDSGWVVGSGVRSGTFQTHAFLAVPICERCVPDINNDTFVNGLDLAILLGRWMETCGANQCFACNPNPSETCRVDLNCDGIVNGLDLAILLGAWTGTTPCGNSCEDSGESAASSSAASSSVAAESAMPSLSELIEFLESHGHDDLVEVLQEAVGASDH